MIKVLSVAVGIVAILFCLYLRWLFSQSVGVVSAPDDLYDFIIVGGGTAGCVLANRLTENEKFRVLLVESGDEESWTSRVPLLVSYLQTTVMSKRYTTVSQKHSLGNLHGNKAFWPRGYGLGGSSSINNMVHMRGIKNDYDTWMKEFKLDVWGYDSVIPYFIKSEQVSGKHCKGHRGCDGPLKTTKIDGITEDHKLAALILDAAKDLNVSVGDDLATLNEEQGFTTAESNSYSGMRYGVAQAYLRPIMGRKNLDVLPNARVTKVLFRDNHRAVGVRVQMTDGQVFEPHATKEVLLCAGVISSPQILVLSGIGPQDKLKQLGIDMISELPGVGQSLVDQLAVPIYFHLNQPISINAHKLKSVWQGLSYFIAQKGYFSQTGIDVVGRISSGQGSNNTRPNLLVLPLKIGSVDEELYTQISNMKSESFQAIFPDSFNQSKEGFILLSICLHPKSRGNIDIKSKNVFESPLIDPKYLTHQQDVDCLTEGYKFASKLSSTEAFVNAGAKIHFPTHYDCRNYVKSVKNKEYLRCLVRMSAITAYHPLGTCRMGERNSNSVVDQYLRVHGVEGLRVVDGSVFPTQVSATPHGTVVMIAEKAADMIKSDHST